MGNTYKENLPVVAAAKFNVAPQAVDDGAGAYGTAVTTGSGRWILGSSIPRGRSLMVAVSTGALTGTPTKLKVSLFGSATDADGTSGAEIAATVTEWSTPAASTVYVAEIDLSGVDDLTKYYSLALTSNGAGATSVIAGATAHILDPIHV